MWLYWVTFGLLVETDKPANLGFRSFTIGTPRKWDWHFALNGQSGAVNKCILFLSWCCRDDCSTAVSHAADQSKVLSQAEEVLLILQQFVDRDHSGETGGLFSSAATQHVNMYILFVLWGLPNPKYKQISTKPNHTLPNQDKPSQTLQNQIRYGQPVVWRQKEI